MKDRDYDGKDYCCEVEVTGYKNEEYDWNGTYQLTEKEVKKLEGK
jgi:hypothetical protein